MGDVIFLINKPLSLPISYPMRNRSSSPGGKDGRIVKLTLHLDLVLRLIMRGNTHPHPLCFVHLHDVLRTLPSLSTSV